MARQEQHEALRAIRNWVTAKDHEQYQNLPDGVVSVTISHSNLQARMMELKFDLHDSIQTVKERIRTHVGTAPQYQRLILRLNGEEICELGDGMLGYYSVESGMEIHVVDDDPYSLSRGGGLEDVSQVEKYRMTEEDYDRRSGTIRDWARQKKAADPTWVPDWEKKPTTGSSTGDGEPEEIPGPEAVAGMAVGQRCEVAPGARRGEIAFLGEVPELKPGHWVGVRLDEPLGKHDGTVKGRAVFSCPDKHGTFARPRHVRAGDFPERDPLAELEDDDDSEEEDEI